MQRLQVFLHFSSPSALPHQVADFAFVVHHVAPKPTGTLSSHVGGGGHGVAASHFFLHFFFVFLHDFFLSVHLSKASSQSSLQVSTSTELMHSGGADGAEGEGEGMSASGVVGGATA